MFSRAKLIILYFILLLLPFATHAQNARVTINRSNASIGSILEEIESQTDYLFIYRKGVDVSILRSISAESRSVYSVLTELFNDTHIRYTLEGNYIVLTASGANTLRLPVSGVVIDESGDPVPSAVVSAGGGRTYTVTDNYGGFSIDIAKGEDLIFSCLGYSKVKVYATPGQKLRVTLEEEFQQLEGTIAIGFGVQKKSDATGSIASIKSNFFQNRAVNNAVDAISGIPSGVQILTNSGDPDSIGSIRIRGLSSNSSASSDPLYIVDGLQVDDLKYLNPQNIESMEVLKDAASAAIYGAQAGNGVIVVTTKTGRNTDGNVFYNTSYSIDRLAWKPKMMNSSQFVDFTTRGGLSTQSTIDQYWDRVTNTDWFDEMFPGGFSARHNFGIQGGSDQAAYYASVSYLDNDGIIYGEKDRLKRLNFQLNASYKVKDWLTIGTTNTVQYKTIADENGSMGGSDSSIMSMVYYMSPLIPLSYSRDKLPDSMRSYLNNGKNLLTLPNGEYISVNSVAADAVNPLVDLYRHPESKNENLDIDGTLYINADILRDLRFTSRLGYILKDSDEYKYEEPWYHDEVTYNSEYSLSEKVKWLFRYQWDNFFNYTRLLGDRHTMDVMAGMTYIEENSRSAGAKTNELKAYDPNFRFLDFSTIGANDEINGIRDKDVSMSYFGRVGFNFHDRYLLQVSFRSDAFDSSRLSTKNRWGHFPSISAGWTLTNEPWMAAIDKKVLSYLKLRASWGINGNIRVLSDFPYSSTVTIGGDQYNLSTDEIPTLASYPSRLANDNLTWEKSKQTDIGVDFIMADGRLTSTVDLYEKNTEDLLVSVTPSYTTGQSSVYMNAGAVRNRGIEFETAWRDFIGDFAYSIGFNISHNDNIVTDLAPSITRISGTTVNKDHKATYFQKGYPVWYMHGYVHDGVDPETGDNIFKDLNDDGQITAEDMTMIGCAQPDFTYGINLSAEYKGLDLSILGTGSQGNDIWFATVRSAIARNLPEVFYTKAWKSPGDVAEYPRYGQSLTASYVRSSACIYDGSYFRVSQIQVGYSLPKQWLNPLNIRNVRVYTSLDDFITISRYIGFDPVTVGDNSGSGRGIDRGTYPSSRKLVFGVNLTF